MKPGPKPTWKILNRGAVPDPAPNHVMLTCLGCGREAQLPILGVALAQLHQGLVFDTGDHAMPKAIQCRHCRLVFETGE